MNPEMAPGNCFTTLLIKCPIRDILARSSQTAVISIAVLTLLHLRSQVRAVMRRTAKVTAKRMLANYMGKATPNGMDPAHAAKLTVKVRWLLSPVVTPSPRAPHLPQILARVP